MKKPSNAGLNPWILAGIFFGVVLLMGKVNADELVHEFKNPSFSGIGTSAHYLTVENQEKSRRDAIKKDIEAALKQAELAVVMNKGTSIKKKLPPKISVGLDNNLANYIAHKPYE